MKDHVNVQIMPILYMKNTVTFEETPQQKERHIN